MVISAVQLLVASIVNAVTFELLVDLPITVIVKNTGPWMSRVGIVGSLLIVTACVIYAFPDIVNGMTRERLYRAFITLLRHLLPWIVLKLLWIPGSYLLCRLTVKLFSRRCHRLKFLNTAKLVVCVLCLGVAFRRTGWTRVLENKLFSIWKRTFIGRFFAGVGQASQPQQPTLRKSTRIVKKKTCYCCG